MSLPPPCAPDYWYKVQCHCPGAPRHSAERPLTGGYFCTPNFAFWRISELFAPPIPPVSETNPVLSAPGKSQP